MRPSRRITSSFRPATFCFSTQAAASRHHAVDVAVLAPVGVEHRALGRDGDVVGERRDDLVVPDARGVLAELLGLVGLERKKRVACVHGGLLVGEAVECIEPLRRGADQHLGPLGFVHDLVEQRRIDARRRPRPSAPRRRTRRCPRAARSGRRRRRAAASARVQRGAMRAHELAAVDDEARQPRRDPVVHQRVGLVGRDRPPGRARSTPASGRCRPRGSASAGRARASSAFCSGAHRRDRAPATTARSASTGRDQASAGASAPATKRAATSPPRLCPSSTSGPPGCSARTASMHAAPGRPAGRRRRRAGRARLASRRGRGGRSRRRASRAALKKRGDVRVAADVLAQAVNEDNRAARRLAAATRGRAASMPSRVSICLLSTRTSSAAMNDSTSREFFELSHDNGVAHLQPEPPGAAEHDDAGVLPGDPRRGARPRATTATTRALVISSTGKHFSAGMALDVFAGDDALLVTATARAAPRLPGVAEEAHRLLQRASTRRASR